MSIQPLPPEVIAQIKSSTTITSLNGVIFELVKNSLDAGSTKIDITVDYSRGSCTIEDNGLGILPSEFGENGGLGKLYHSSRLNSPTPVHAKRGTFLASLSAISLLMITSHHFQHRSHNTLSMHKSQVVSRHVPAYLQQHLTSFGHGTRVSVRDLFGSMPVRVKQRAIIAAKHGGSTKEWALLKMDVVMLLLAWAEPVSVFVRELGINRKLVIRAPALGQPHAGVGITKVCSVLSQASFITAEERSSWVPVKASTATLRILGVISLDPVATKYVQFVAFGIQPVAALNGHNILQDEINRLFQNSAFGSEDEWDERSATERERRASDGRYKDDGFTNKELKGRKGVDRWPMFYIKIEFLDGSANTRKLGVDDILDDRANSLGAVIELLQAMIVEFLTRNHFRPKATRFQRQPIYNDENPKRTNTIQATYWTSRPAGTPEARSSALGTTPNPKKPKLGNAKGSKSDPLGTNIKLPSFRRLDSAIDMPFGAWSRMKSGTVNPRTNGSKDPFLPPIRPSTAPLPIQPPVQGTCAISLRLGSMTSESGRDFTPLISSTGKVIRPPFDDIPAQPTQLKAPALDPTVSKILTPPYPPEDDADDVFKWINPITKVESVVNRRTGLTIPARQSSARSTATSNTRLSSHTKLPSTVSSAQKPSPWITSVLEKWDNPIFQPTEISIPQVSFEGEAEKVMHGHHHHCTQVNIDNAFKETSSGIVGRISKDALQDAEVISQVDKKFILVKLTAHGGFGNQLVIIDQHAADERIRIECLMEELCTPSAPDDYTDSTILTMQLEMALVFDVPAKDINLFRSHKSHFATWGILYDTSHEATSLLDKQSSRLTVRSLPPGIVERCKTDPRLLINLLRTEAWKLHDKSGSYSYTIPRTLGSKQSWLANIHTCPQGIIDMLNSRACRSAIMFNDELSNEQCKVLVQRLAECAFPFQCAHGRPSLVPLVELGSLQVGMEGDWDDGGGFGTAFSRWKASQN